MSSKVVVGRRARPKIPSADWAPPPPNPKYAGVRPQVDSGPNTLRKRLDRLSEVRRLYRMRPDEIFRRVNVTALMTLMLEQAKLEMQEEDLATMASDAEEEDRNISSSSADSAIEEDGGGEKGNEDDEVVVQKSFLALEIPRSGRLSRSTSNLALGHQQQVDLVVEQESGRLFGRRLFSGGMYSNRSNSVADLVQGIGELDALESASQIGGGDTSASPLIEGRPYLLLDVRTEDEYDAGHIKTAQSYPQSRLLRCMNFETRSMLKFKNKEKKIIVVYDEDESVASKCATTLVQRGYDNVFMLSGGLKACSLTYEDKLVLTREEAERNFSEEEVFELEERTEEVLERGSTRMGSSRLGSYAPSLRSSASNVNSRIGVSSGSVKGSIKILAPSSMAKQPLVDLTSIKNRQTSLSGKSTRISIK